MPNGNGIRLITSVLEGAGRSAVNVINAISGIELYQQFISINNCNAGQTINVYAAQNSGANINAYPYIYAIILKRLL